MNRKEAIRQTDQERRLEALGLTAMEAEQLRRISMQLSRWDEALCNDTEEDEDGKAYRYCGPMMGRRYRVPNRGAGALRRLGAIAMQNPHLFFYHQSDPRGVALYVGTWDSLAGLPLDSYYTRGLAVW